MQSQSLIASGSARPSAVLAAAGASRRLAALRPGPAGRPRGLAPLPPSQRPAPGLLRRREERQQQAEGPWATPEKQQLHSGERPEEAEAAMQRYPWHSDEWKEEYRKHLRVTFDFERWRTHRSAGRYWRHMASLARSNTVQGLARPLAYVLGVSAAVAAYHAAAAAGHVPLWPALRFAANAPFGLASFALSLLLVFRTNASYGRWDEARKMWGSIVNRSRDLVRQGLGYIHPRQPELQAALCRWTIAFSRSLMCHLREGEDLEAELRDVLPPDELQELLAAPHRPNHCCQVLTEVLREAQLPGSHPAPGDAQAAVPAGAAYRMDENLTLFADVVGGCERLLKTPIPLAYTRHTSRFLMIWLTLLPFTLWESCGWAMLPVIAVVAFFLLGIEEIGVSIEEPFSILPLEGICRGIEDSVRGMAATHSARQGRSRRWAQTSPAPAPHAPQQVAELLQRGARRSNVNSLPAGLFASQPINGGQ